MSITADCDRDAVTVLVEKDGPACHTGSDSCFGELLWHSEERNEFSLDALAKLIAPPIILPIGAIMSFIGGPVFLILLFRGRNSNVRCQRHMLFLR